MRDPTLRNKTSGAVPTIPLFMHIHKRKLQWTHDLAFSMMVNEIPELATKKFVAISDDEFTELMARHFKKAVIAVDQVHLRKDIGE